MRKFIIFLVSQFCFVAAHADTVQQLEAQVQAGKFAHAATTGLSLLMHQPDDVQIRFLTALALQKNQQPEQAIRHYKSLIDQHPDLPEPRNNLAIIYLQQGQYEAAVNMLESSLKTHPVYATTWQNLNSIYQALASDAYRKALNDERETQSTMPQVKLAALDRLHQPVQIGLQTAKLAPARSTATTAVVSPGLAAKSAAGTGQTTTAADQSKLKRDVESALQAWAQAW